MAAMKRFAIAFAFLLASTGLAFACKCASPAPNLNLHTRRAWAEWKWENAQVVFEGKVDHVELTGWPLKPEPGKTIKPWRVQVSFSNVRLYRGGKRERFIVETGLGGGDCGYPFKAGESYLVDAWKNSSGGLETGICAATTPVESAATALRLLRGEPATPEDLADLANEPAGRTSAAPTTKGKICGRVSFPTGVTPAAVTLRVWPAGEDERSILGADEVESKSDGSFCFSGLDPGKYFVGASQTDLDEPDSRYLGYYPGVLQRIQAKSIDLKPRDTARADFMLFRQPLYSVRGYLRGVPEPVVGSIQVMLMPAQFEMSQVVDPVPLGPHGEFELDQVSPGHYTAFAASVGDEDDTMTFLSSVVKLDIHGDVDDLKLEFVPRK